MNFPTRINDTMRSVESSLWQYRTLILVLAGAILALRHWTTGAATVSDATYPIAEMLINYADGFVRRGLSGDIILSLSQTFGGAPTIWAGWISCLLGGALFALTLRIYARMPDDPSLLPVVLAPWGLLFLLYDPDVMIRKEVFGYLSLGALLLGTLSINPKRALLSLIFSCLMMPIAILLHEVNANLAGSMLIAAGMFLRAHPDQRKAIYGWVAFATGASVLSFVAVALHPTADPRVMCDAVQFSECENPFGYFSDTAVNGMTLTREKIDWEDITITVVLVLACALPFRAFRMPRQNPLLIAGIITIIAVPVLPLFVIAVDYGRWITLIFFPASLLAITALTKGWITYRAFFSPIVSVLYCGTWSFYHWGVVPQIYAVMLWPLLGLAIGLCWLCARIKRAP